MGRDALGSHDAVVPPLHHAHLPTFTVITSFVFKTSRRFEYSPVCNDTAQSLTLENMNIRPEFYVTSPDTNMQ